MDKKLLDEIDASLEQKKEREEKNQALRSEREAQEKASEQVFQKCRDSVYRPAFEEFQTLMREKGIDTKIDEADEKIVDVHSKQPAYIAFGFLVGDGWRKVSDYPHLSLRFDKARGTVALHRSTIGPNRGGSSGDDGSYQPEALTTQVIQEKLTQVLVEILK